MLVHSAPSLYFRPEPMAAPESTTSQLISGTEALFSDFATPGTPTHVIVSHFSTTHVPTLDHAPSKKSPCGELDPTFTLTPLIGLNAVRSYFDLLSMHYTRQKVTTHSIHAFPEKYQVVTTASILWKWNKSKKEWTEDVECTLDFDEQFRVRAFFVRTLSEDETCVMRAVDYDTPYFCACIALTSIISTF